MTATMTTCERCLSTDVDFYAGKNGAYVGAWCAEHAPVAFDTVTGELVFSDGSRGGAR